MPWAHLDIAGVADDFGRPYARKGASGWGVRLLIELARAQSGSPPPDAAFTGAFMAGWTSTSRPTTS